MPGQDKKIAAGEGKGAEKLENSKIQGGGASTLQGGRRITITRGVNLDNTDWKGEDLRGVAFQQSVVRAANFEVCFYSLSNARTVAPRMLLTAADHY